MTASDDRTEAEANKRLGWRVVDWSKLHDPPDLVSGFVYFLLFLLGLAALVLAGILLMRIFDAAASGTPDDVNKLLLGLGALIGAPFLVWRVLIAAQQTAIARETMYTTLFTKAVEQLGAMREIVERGPGEVGAQSNRKFVPNTEVRLGAIYALERIAQDSERDHWPIMETLCAYVRQNAGKAVRETQTITAIKRIPPPNRSLEQFHVLSAWEEKRTKTVPIDVQAALNVLGRRSEVRKKFEKRLRKDAGFEDAYRLDLSDCNLPFVVLSGMSFEEAFFCHSNLRSARFENTNLKGANFLGTDVSLAHFEGADCAVTWFGGANADGASFVGCRLASAWLASVKFGLSMFFDANLEGAVLIGSDLSESHLDERQLASAYGNATTSLPSGIQCPESWPKESTIGSISKLQQEHFERRLKFCL